jgi:hypothetical protein
MALPITAFLKDKRNIVDMSEHAVKFSLPFGDCHSYGHHICQEMITQFSPHYKKKIVFLEATLSYADIINHMNGAPYEKMFIGQSHRSKKNEGYSGFYYTSLNDCFDFMMHYKQVIFLSLTIEDYGADTYKDKKSKMIAHGTTAILLPIGDNYKMFYINSHGRDMKTTNFYDFPLTKTRDKHIVFDESIDTHIMKFLVSKFNRRENNKVHLEFNGDSKDTYNGVNLQSGDGHGSCFIFPYIMWYYFGLYYNKMRVVGDITIPTVKHMLLSGNINKFVHSAFIDFSDKFKNCFVENIREFKTKKQNIDTLERCVINGGTIFIKKIVNTTMSYLTQAYYVEKINNNKI